MITVRTWEWHRRWQRQRMAKSEQELTARGIRIVTAFDDALRAQDIRDEANEWPCKWGLR